VTPAGITEQETAARVRFPDRLGDARGIIDLHKLGPRDYAWDTQAAIALGTIPARDVADGIVALFTSSGNHPEIDYRTDYLTAFPHTSAVLSHLFSLDSLFVEPDTDGSALVTVHFTMKPDGLRPRYPALADYMQKYVDGTSYDFTLSDHHHTAYFRASGDSGPMMLQCRVRGHHFLPLHDGELPLPDSLTISGSFSTHIMIFTVGVHHFSGDFVIERSAHERSWTFHFDQEPDWQLPIATAALLGSSLHRPFEGKGLWYRLAVRDSAGAQTILSRTSHSEVHENGMMRFIGGLISRVVLELDGDVQAQEYDYYGRAFAAMRTDFADLLPAH
jgi:hypothetical protein